MANRFNIPVPMDANGCVVPLDTRELVYRGETHEVYGFSFDYSARYGRRNWGAVFENNDVIRLNACTMPDSWEKLEEDLDRSADALDYEACTYFGKSAFDCSSCIADKSETCERVVMRDIADRIRKLRGKD